MTPRLHLTLALATTALACSSSPKPAPVVSSGASAAPAPIDEAAFKALHDAPADAPPSNEGEMIEISGAKAYLSLPAGKPIAGVLVIHEWWGLNANIQHWADRLAAAGYAALAVDLYRGKVATDSDSAMAAMKAVDATEAIDTLTAAHRFLVEDPRIQARKTGSIGWCFGGKWSLEAAIAIADLDAAVIYYGHPNLDSAQLSKIEAKILAIFGEQDASIPRTMVDELEATLDRLDVDAKVLRYDAAHAFANPSQKERYDAKAAAQAWDEVQRFFAENLR